MVTSGQPLRIPSFSAVHFLWLVCGLRCKHVSNIFFVFSGWPLSGHPLSTKSVPCAASLTLLPVRIFKICQEEKISVTCPINSHHLLPFSLTRGSIWTGRPREMARASKRRWLSPWSQGESFMVQELPITSSIRVFEG